MAVFLKALVCSGALCLALFIGSGCSSSIQPSGIMTTGVAQQRAWMPIGPERLYARESSLDKARRSLWLDLMQEKSNSGQSVEKMTLLHPDFNSRLRGLVALADVQSFEEQENGSLIITIELDQKSVLDLIQEYSERY